MCNTSIVWTWRIVAKYERKFGKSNASEYWLARKERSAKVLTVIDVISRRSAAGTSFVRKMSVIYYPKGKECVAS